MATTNDSHAIDAPPRRAVALAAARRIRAPIDADGQWLDARIPVLPAADIRAVEQHGRVGGCVQGRRRRHDRRGEAERRRLPQPRLEPADGADLPGQPDLPEQDHVGREQIGRAHV